MAELRANSFYFLSRIGDNVILHFAKPCHRCIVTVVDPETGIRNKNGEPLKTLRTYRMTDPSLSAPIFALNFGIDRCGIVNIGDVVYAEL